MNVIVKNIPNTITCMNLLSGCLAVYFSFSAISPVWGNLLGWQVAVICIFAAAVFDFCDGFAARMLHAYSDIGKELDSLSDLVSFGVAPALLLVNVLGANTCCAGGETATWLTWFAFLIPIMGALRLARFNVVDSEGDNRYFCGLPIPANALFWIGYVAWINRYGIPDDYIVAIGILLVSLSMVSNLTLPSLKFHNLALRGNLARYLVIIETIVLVCIFGLSGFMWAIVVYLFIGVFYRRTAEQ